jgi:DNA-binding MarR family transcriptional regulator
MPKSALLEELRQRKPFRNPAEEATLSIARTASMIRRHISAVVEPAGITLSQYNVLRILRGAGSEGLPTLAVRDRLIEEAPGITRLVDKLEAAGFVTRERSKPDRRQVFCYITPKGLALLKHLAVDVASADEIGGAGLTAREQRSLNSMLAKVRAAGRTAGRTAKGRSPSQ